uniref:RING-type domain-containing protein n=1 Tax=Pseudictyota dubia TaxID=2749911 RepID=A0A7R9Z5C7_9STRA|mmetsp:Transcript_2421/g.4229  ORF Transcript_2421/g.4229 Transcript_2421/m.4229 type:complete len:341 (+) Transcript_2421:176-1198(+)
MNDETAGCHSNELEFSIDRQWYSNSFSSWSLSQVLPNSRRLLLEGNRYSTGYPYQSCLPRSECYEIAAANLDFYLCRWDSGGYNVRVEEAVDCFSRNGLERIYFGECNEVLWYRGGYNGSVEEESVSEGGGSLFAFFFGICIAVVVVCCACIRRRSRRPTTNVVTVVPSSNGRGASQTGRTAAQRPGQRVNPSPSAPSSGPAYGSEQRKQFVNENLVTKELTAGDVAPVNENGDENATTHSVRSLGSIKERSDFVQSSVRSLEVRMAERVSSEKEKSIMYSDGVCTICLEDYVEGDIVCTSSNPDCAHIFHADCMTDWLMGHEDCPNCRLKYLNGSSENV